MQNQDKPVLALRLHAHWPVRVINFEASKGEEQFIEDNKYVSELSSNAREVASYLANAVKRGVGFGNGGDMKATLSLNELGAKHSVAEAVWSPETDPQLR